MSADLQNLLLVQLRASRLLFVTNDESHDKTIKESFSALASVDVYNFDDLCFQNTRTVSGRTIVLISPEIVVGSVEAKGIIDGGIAKLLAGLLWRKLVVVRESGEAAGVSTRPFPQPQQLLAELAQSVAIGVTDSTAWLNELLLSLIYRRHLTVKELLRILPYSIWWHKFQPQRDLIEETIRTLTIRKLAKKEKGRLTCTRQGMMLVERRIPYSEKGLGNLKTLLEQQHLHESNAETEEESPRWWKEKQEAEEDDIIKRLTLDFLDNHDWITVKDADRNAIDSHAVDRSSPTRIRRLLEGMVKDEVLTRLTYVRGVGRPTFLYRRRDDGDNLAWLENRCGECVFYLRAQRRCRLWWAVNRFDGNAIHSRWTELPRMAHEKLRYGISGMGPNATACNYYAPKKKDFPLRNTPETCSGCGTAINAPLAKVVQCANCGTKYKPVKDRILVLYNYEQIFRERYSKIVGFRPPERALALRYSDENEQPVQRDLIVLYPTERVVVRPDGISIEKERAESFEPYDRIYGVIDYGALSESIVAQLREKGLNVSRRNLVQDIVLSPDKQLSPGFAEKLNRFRGERATEAIADSLLRSVIIATRRILTIQGRHLQPELTQRQLLEYARFKHDSCRSNLDVLLAYEARISNQYWKAYKLRLRIVGLDFKSRVRDRFVREIVRTPRARARGYSPVSAGINYLHQRRLLKCRLVNVRLGLGWDGFEGIIHVAKRKQAIGLLLDLSDQFKLADREVFLGMCSKNEVTAEDFVGARGRQGVRFYFPSSVGVEKLEQAGQVADQLPVYYGENEMSLVEAYQKYVKSFIANVENQSPESLIPFLYGLQKELEWLRGAT
jgi:hypothetical protein